ncbi:hypothetical protein Pcinc_003309 [Petrolisthes cinctipes]|uniref:Uncharacterized protein n=1 Tax=Petrolisthes cinctipes TaxID=88211 RepID=A0AAE1L250_PETCI|nr:hypothetical protein Pcinc_003309 [Petrolisthes cinctipes]
MFIRFDAKQFCSEPPLQNLQGRIISKDDWKFVAYYFDITYESSQTKEMLKNLVIQQLTNRNLLPEEAVAVCTPLSCHGSDSQISEDVPQYQEKNPCPEPWSEARLEFEREKLQLELKERERDREFKRLALEGDRELKRLELEEKGRDRQIEIAKIQQLEESTQLKVEELSYNPVSVVTPPAINSKKPNYKQDKSEEFCSYCKQPGHNILHCTHPKCKTPSTYKLTLATVQKPTQSEKLVTCIQTNSLTSDPFSAFKVTGTVSLPGNTQTYPVTILRDTGSAQSLLCKKALPSVENHYTGEIIILKSLNCTPTAGMADIHVQSELMQGPVRVAVLETDLPIPGVTFLLGNDLAGHGMIPDVVVREKPVNESPAAKLDQEKPHLFPVCVVTRSKTVSVAVDSPSLSHRDTLFSQVMNRENLIRAQEEDPSLAKLRHIADDKPINVPFRGLKEGGVTDSWSRPQQFHLEVNKGKVIRTRDLYYLPPKCFETQIPPTVDRGRVVSWELPLQLYLCTEVMSG